MVRLMYALSFRKTINVHKQKEYDSKLLFPAAGNDHTGVSLCWKKAIQFSTKNRKMVQSHPNKQLKMVLLVYTLCFLEMSRNFTNHA